MTLLLSLGKTQKGNGKVYVKLSKVYLLNIGYWKLYRQLSKETGTPIASLPHVDGSAHGLRTPNQAFFIEIQNFWAWADKFWGIWGIFGQTISTHFGTVTIQPLFLQKTKPLYPNPKYLFGIEI